MTSKWFVIPKQNPEAKYRLFCLPYSAGSAATYVTWADQLPPQVELIAVQPPGRAARIGEAAITTMAELVDALVVEIEPWLSKPYVVFGHSLGSRVGFELLHQVQQRGWRQPSHFIASGSNGPQICRDHKKIVHLDDESFIEGLKQFSPPNASAIFDNPKLLALFMPMIRADFAIADSYFREVGGAPLDCPVSVFGGAQDSDAPPEELATWQPHFSQPLQIDVFAGGHFFVESDATAVVTKLKALFDNLG